MNWTRRSFIGRGLFGMLAALAAPRPSDAQPASPPARRSAIVLCSRGER